MWVFLILVWRMLAKVMRRLGRGALLVPVAAMGMALFGVSVWTVAAVVAALVLALRQPATAAGLLPPAMLGMGGTGLVLASDTPGYMWQTAIYNLSLPFLSFHGAPSAAAQHAAAQAAATRLATVRSAFNQAAVNLSGRAAVPPPGSGSGNFAGYSFVPRGTGVAMVSPVSHSVRQVVVVAHPVPSRAQLLVPLSLLLLALGLWLAPRTFGELRGYLNKLAAYLRARRLEERWGLLLIPVSLIGLSIFGVRPWTVAAVIAAVIIAFRWPRLAADLIPPMLIGFAICGFILVIRWQSVPAWWLPGQPGGYLAPVQYGAVRVDSPQTALLAGVEASALLAAGAWLFPRTIGAHARVRGQDVELAGRVQRLTETREHAIDAATAELRRIERDLHDGAQARLVALGMNLRAVERMIPASPQAALALVAEARETSARALGELRHLVRGICPPVLADRGLSHALRALALDTALPVELDLDLPGRLTAPVESACYFAVAEALANAVKHSGAHRVHIRIQHAAGLLRIEVADDGIGGADPAAGTGLRGVERRLGTFDGILAVSSPAGGPTMIAMEVPCALLSPKTSSCSGTG